MWTDDVASFSGRCDNVTPSWVYPKPVRGTVPVVLGNAGPLGVRHAAFLRGEDGRPEVAGWVERFRIMVAEEGRDPADATRENIERYGEAS